MLQSILGEKRGMTQAWTKDGTRVPVSIIQAGPIVVTQIKTNETHGYEAVQVGFGARRIKNLTKPMIGHLKKASQNFSENNKLPRYIKELKMSYQDAGDSEQSMKIGDVVKATDVFAPGDVVKVMGTSKGKGFQGGVRRWGFAGGPRTHGQSLGERAPGSIGQTTTPGRVMKGKKMAGRMGGDRVTVANLTVLDVTDDGTLKLSGPVPGPAKGLLQIEKTGKDEKFAGLAGKAEEVELPEVEVQPEEQVEEVDEGGINSKNQASNIKQTQNSNV